MNGWTNFETWITRLHFLDDFNLDEIFDGQDYDEQELADYIKSTVEDHVDEQVPNHGYVRDMIMGSLHLIDYRQLARAFMRDKDI